MNVQQFCALPKRWIKITALVSGNAAVAAVAGVVGGLSGSAAVGDAMSFQ